jgi:Domain of unknown function DUF29
MKAERADRESREKTRIAGSGGVETYGKQSSYGSSMGESERSISKDVDFHAWLLDQADKLRGRRLVSINPDDLAEELEAMARRDRLQLPSHLQNLLSHLLKWEYEPSRRSKSWVATINESRDRIHDLLEESPSLKNELNSVFAESRAYRRAVRDAVLDTDGNIRFPERSPWTLDTILDPDFLP